MTINVTSRVDSDNTSCGACTCLLLDTRYAGVLISTGGDAALRQRTNTTRDVWARTSGQNCFKAALAFPALSIAIQMADYICLPCTPAVRISSSRQPVRTGWTGHPVPVHRTCQVHSLTPCRRLKVFVAITDFVTTALRCWIQSVCFKPAQV